MKELRLTLSQGSLRKGNVRTIVLQEGDRLQDRRRWIEQIESCKGELCT